MNPPIEFLFPSELGAELIYSFVIIICSLMIYYSTREVYELSSYKGIKYFRQAFLFFAVAYFCRYFIMFLLNFFGRGFFSDIQGIAFPISIFIFMYFSSMAVFYLLYSVMWKKWNHDRTRISFFSLISVVIASLGIILHGMTFPIFMSIMFFLFSSFILSIAYKDAKKKNGGGMLGIYLLLFVFFFLNIINTLLPKFFQLYQILVYLISIFLFMSILYKVLRKVGN